MQWTIRSLGMLLNPLILDILVSYSKMVTSYSLKIQMTTGCPNLGYTDHQLLVWNVWNWISTSWGALAGLVICSVCRCYKLVQPLCAIQTKHKGGWHPVVCWSISVGCCKFCPTEYPQFNRTMACIMHTLMGWNSQPFKRRWLWV